MPDRSKFIRKFRIRHDEAWSWHFGLFFCIEPRCTSTGKRDFYLFLALGKHDISIGMISEYDPWGEKGTEED